MLRQLAAIALKELTILMNDREALALLFAMPVFFILVMSFALQGVFEAGTAERPIEVLVVNLDEGPTAGRIAADIDAMAGLRVISKINDKTITLSEAERLITEGDGAAALIFGSGFSESVERYAASAESTPPRIPMIVDPAVNRRILAPVQAAIGAAMERRAAAARLTRQIRDLFPGLGALPLESLQGSLNAEQHRGPWSVTLDIVPPRGAENNRRPRTTEQNVPGYTIFGVFFIVLPLATGFMRERHEGTFRRILAAPISRGTVLVGKLLPYYLVNLIQIVLMFGVGKAIFGIHLGRPQALLLVSLALAACANGLGLMVAALGRTEAQVGAMGVFFAVVLSAMGGMMVPAFVMPDLMQTLSRLTPHAWALSGYHDVMLRGQGITGVLKETAVLLSFAALFFIVALWRFRFTEE
jgi:ABC-2 type transport system permease protein